MKTLLLILLMTSYCLAQSGGLLNATRGIPQPNDPAGTTLNGTAIINSAGNAVTAPASTTNPVRIVIGGAGTSGNAVLALTGTLAPCIMDTTIASGGGAYFVVPSTTAGQCHPQPGAPTPGTWVIGFLAVPSTTSGSPALVHMNGFFYGTAAGGGASLSSLTAATVAHTINNLTFPQTWNWTPDGTQTAGMTFAEQTAATGGTATSALVGINTLLGSTYSPLNVTQGEQNAGSVPALQVHTRWNAAAGSFTGINFLIDNAASATTSSLFQIMAGAGATTQEFRIDPSGNLFMNGTTLTTLGLSSNLRVCAGAATNCQNNVSGAVGGAFLDGADNVSIAASARGGATVVRGGLLTTPTPNAAAMEGPIQIGAGFVPGTVAAVGDVVCQTSAAFVVSDCGFSPVGTNPVGIATATAQPFSAVVYGTAVVALDATSTAGIGNLVCMSTTTAGKGHDQTAVCPAGQGIGVLIANTGTVSGMVGASVPATSTLSSTAPSPAGQGVLVMLHFR